MQGGLGSIPGQGIRVPYAMQRSQKTYIYIYIYIYKMNKNWKTRKGKKKKELGGALDQLHFNSRTQATQYFSSWLFSFSLSLWRPPLTLILLLGITSWILPHRLPPSQQLTHSMEVSACRSVSPAPPGW